MGTGEWITETWERDIRGIMGRGDRRNVRDSEERKYDEWRIENWRVVNRWKKNEGLPL